MNKVGRGISKAEAYKCGIFCHEYDLEAMVDAYGLEEILSMATEFDKRLKKNKRLNKKKRERLKTAA